MFFRGCLVNATRGASGDSYYCRGAENGIFTIPYQITIPIAHVMTGRAGRSALNADKGAARPDGVRNWGKIKRRVRERAAET